MKVARDSQLVACLTGCLCEDGGKMIYLGVTLAYWGLSIVAAGAPSV